MGIYLGKFVHTETGKIIMSILLGFGLASLFRTICKGKDCVIFHSASLDEIKKKTYKYDNKCYKYEIEASKCNTEKKIIDF